MYNYIFHFDKTLILIISTLQMILLNLVTGATTHFFKAWNAMTDYKNSFSLNTQDIDQVNRSVSVEWGHSLNSSQVPQILLVTFTHLYKFEIIGTCSYSVSAISSS